MPVSDYAFMLRATSAGTLVLADSPETGTGVRVGPGPLHGMKLRVYAPGFVAGSTLTIHIEEGDTLGGAYTDVPDGAMPAIGAAGTFEHHIHWTKAYLRYYAVVAGAGADFGIVTIGLTPGEIATT